ncbi:L-fucose mutarotase [Gracilibacillus halotolerans]|uniref:L-fucose mutarotase n=1 Tax=Gracilibacillus halotolerans TaxID=74386 RepID=A0A841RMT3_9BACI|nr:RbsD/FucU domain-containing protein [Gracilibacillus halotolerans]MBB6514121.1 L-fucose mutarotase [Gracilibacillus halotolerans]
MLRNIPDVISPELLKILHEMGHGDELVIADGNFPAARLASRLVRCDGHQASDLLKAILTLFPVDTFVEKPITLMQVVDDKTEMEPEIWNVYKGIFKKLDVEPNQINYEERFTFYEKAKAAYAIVATSEKALYGNIILKKGVLY